MAVDLRGPAPPPGWGLNSLTNTIDLVRANQFATYFRKQMVVDIVAIDRILWGLLVGHVDPNPMVPMNFLLRAHSCFRAAAGCALGGQVYEATVLQRAVLEAAAYGLYIGRDNERAERWFRREESSSAKDRVRKEFGTGNLRRFFEEAHSRVAPAFVSLYEALVDFGGHPNEAGFSISTTLREEDRLRMIDTVYLHEDGLPLDFGLKNTIRVGLWAILAFREIYPGPYEDRGFASDVDALLPHY